MTRLGQGRLFSRFWRSGSGFWRGPSGWPIRVLTVSLVILIGLQIIVQYRLNFWNRDFFDALQQRNASMLWRQALLFLPLAAASITLGILSVWGRMTAQRKWREWLTKHGHLNPKKSLASPFQIRLGRSRGARNRLGI